MKTNIATTREQSDRLLQCGVSAESADMVFNEVTGLEVNAGKTIPGGYFPAFSLSALLGLLPTSILGPTGNGYMLELSKLRMHDAWEVQWWNGISRFTTRDKRKVFHKLWDASPIEACVKAIEWLTECGYQLNDVEKGGEDE